MSRSEKAKRLRARNRSLIVVLCAAAAVVVLVVVLALTGVFGSLLQLIGIGGKLDEYQTAKLAEIQELPVEGFTAEANATLPWVLSGNELAIVKLGQYSGTFVENGNDVVVDDLLAIVVTNISGEYLEYAKITLESARGDCTFVISALPAGESVLVQEYQAAAYGAGNAYAFKEAEMYFYDALPSLMTDRYLLEGGQNSITLTNLQTQNVTSPVCVYYKTYVGGMYFGGITYRVRFEDGLTSGQPTQNGAGHYLPGCSRLMFITEEGAN